MFFQKTKRIGSAKAVEEKRRDQEKSWRREGIEMKEKACHLRDGSV